MLDTLAKSQDRITVWRNYKKQNPSKNQIIEYIGQIKPTDRSFDFYDTKNWPTSWEILESSLFCYSGKALLLHDTLVHTGYIKPDLIKWFVADNFEICDVGLAFSEGLCYYNILPDRTVKRENLDNYINIIEKFQPHKTTNNRK